MPPKKRPLAVSNPKNPEKTDSKKRKEEDEILKIFSWNVAGLRACVKKNCAEVLRNSDADIIFLQKTKCDEFPEEISALPHPFKYLLPSKVKKGHAGVAMLARKEPIKISFGFGEEKFDEQGRWIHAEYENYHIIGTYVPNSGDLNVAHEEIDLKNPESNRNKTPSFTDQERQDFTNLLNAGFIDVYRKRFPIEKDCYTYWSYAFQARPRNIGWRIDYFVVSERIFENVESVKRFSEIYGSDHCPIEMNIKI
uniref:DNA-(apurinic or apyrimidinic site) endonuclease n=1 Tax=Panagrolaimus sp. PS1159 TaxID=55785 RepID=A0AC35F3Z3_9BILA